LLEAVNSLTSATKQALSDNEILYYYFQNQYSYKKN